MEETLRLSTSKIKLGNEDFIVYACAVVTCAQIREHRSSQGYLVSCGTTLYAMTRRKNCFRSQSQVHVGEEGSICGKEITEGKR